jgi:hypothetical protein
MQIIPNFLRRKPPRLQLEPSKAAAKPAFSFATQLRESWQSPIASNISPFMFDLGVYDSMLEAIPLLSSAVWMWIDLVGLPIITAENPTAQTVIDDFVENCSVNRYNKGLISLQSQVLHSAISKGFGIFETVLSRQLKSIVNVVIGRPNDFQFLEKDGQLVLMQNYGRSNAVVFDKMDNIYYLSYHNENGHPQGLSIFKSLPAVSQIFTRLLKAVDNGVWRFGDPSFFMKIRGGSANTAADFDPATATPLLKAEFTKLMQARKQGQVGDLTIGIPESGDASISVIGGDYQLPNLEIPFHITIEELLAPTGLPNFMFPLYRWTSTEKMSQVQNQKIIAKVEYYRTGLSLIYKRLFATLLLLSGLGDVKLKISWSSVNLLDLVDSATARKLNAEAAAVEIENTILEAQLGITPLDELLGQKNFTPLQVEQIKYRLAERVKYAQAVKLYHQLQSEGKLLAVV